MPTSRIARIALLVATGVLLVGAAVEIAYLVPYIGAQHAIGTDHTFYRGVGERWLETGRFYGERQLAGPYTVEADVDVLYPPIALLLFVPLVWLPFPLWWAVPAIVVGYALWRFRPAPWTWPLLAFLLAWPRGVSNLIYGNSDMWVMAAVAGGLLAGWPGVLVIIKPSVLPFALAGITRRAWWIGAAALAIVSVPMLGLWLEYPAAIHNSDAQWYYALDDMPPLLIPVVAWLGRRDAPHDWRALAARVRARRFRHGHATG